MATQFEMLSHPDNAASVTPDNSTLLTNPGILYIGGAGDVSVLTAGGESVTFSGMTAGSFLPVVISRVNSTGTTATNILVLY